MPPLRSLRSKTIIVLIGGVLIAAASAAALTFGFRQADRLIDRANQSQNQVDLLLLLAGRVSDFSIAALEGARTMQAPGLFVSSAATEVNAVFDLLETSIEKQVLSLGSGEERNAEAAEGLAVARMRAQFQNLVRQLSEGGERSSNPDDRVAEARRLVDAFGLQISPLLSQAVEDERREAQGARDAISALKTRLITIAAALAAGTLALSLLLYLGPVRSILRRLDQTVQGAEAIASGRLDTRLASSGEDELAGLMHSFNRMAESLAKREAALIGGKKGLERTIAERTAELRDANQQLEEIDRNRRRFFADISHELRTPLTVILGEAELMLRQGNALSPDHRASVETIQTRARRLNRRVEDMLRVARSESGRLELSLTRAEAGEIAAEAVQDVLSLAKRSGIDVRLERGPGDLYVLGDKDWLRQLCGGLIANAIKFSSPPGPIEVAARKEGCLALLEVSDRGQGIAEEDRPRVFDRFYQGHNRGADSPVGHGVGLALARWIVEEHKGNIELQSPGRLAIGGGAPGTTVIVRLALAQAATSS